ncbi:MAG: transglycosylase [Ruminococcaceae bacterium]|nr:transglycosylase [Oscillospiraceae bacterium]
MSKKGYKMKPKKTMKSRLKNLAIGIFEVLTVFKNIILRVLGAAVNVVLTLLLVLAITGVIVGCAFAIYLGNYIDASVEEFDLMSTDQDKTTVIYYYDEYGNPVELGGGKLYSSENRVWVSYEQIPENLINAFIAIEDKRFEDHDGVDWKRTVRATMLFALGQADSGGSTLTQQLIKNVTKNDDNTIQRKVEEIFCALNLEKVKSKEEILELYMNTVYFSQGAYGVQAAAYEYFNKDVSELTLIECASLAGIVKNPYSLDPRLHPDNNAERRDYILYEMLDQGKITQLEYDEAAHKELGLYDKDEDSEDTEIPSTEIPETEAPATDDPYKDEETTKKANSWYMDAVIEDGIKLLSEKYEVTEKAAEQMLYSGGFKIYIAMDPKVQTIMEEVYEDDAFINSIVEAPEGLMQPQSAMVVLDPTSGNILGLVGGRGKKTENRLFNYATMAKRQPGSSFKPIAVYSLALEKGLINYSTLIDDTPYTFNTSVSSTGSVKYTAWPINSPQSYRGLTVLNDAVARSVNTVAIKVLSKIGVQESFDHVTKNLGITTLVDKKVVNDRVVTDITLSSMGLGGTTYGVTVRELTGAYTIFTNEGTYVSPRTILEIRDEDNKMIIDNQPVINNVLSIENAALMTRILENVTQRSTGTGYGQPISKMVDTAGKTGTTSKNNDKWFMGFTPYYIGGVWFGYEIPQSLSSFPGNPSVRIWNAVMVRLHEEIIAQSKATGVPLKEFELPSSIVTIKYCKDSGLIATPACELDPRGNRIETGYYTADNMPNSFCDKHITVKYCNTGSGVASEYCPDEECREISLLHITDRDFPVQVRIVDAQYVYRTLTNGKVVYSKNDGPFFKNEIEKGHYVGITSSSKHFNKYCAVHYKGQPFGAASIPETLVPETPTAEPPKDVVYSDGKYYGEPN